MYIVLIATLCFFSVLFYQTKKVLIIPILRNKKSYTLSSVCFIFSLFLLWFMLCFKSINVGIDTPNYKFFYENTVDNYFTGDRQWGIFSQFLYYYIFKFLKAIGFSFQSACVFIYSVVLISMSILLKKNANNPIQALLLFICMGGFGMYASALRQVMAAALGYIAIHYQLKESNKKTQVISIIMILLSILIHNTAIILIVPWILNLVLKNHKQIILFGIISMLFSILLPVSLLKNISRYVISDKYENLFGLSSNFLYILVYLCMFVIIVWQNYMPNIREKIDDRMLLYAIMAVVLMVVSSKFYLVSRLTFYFSVPLCISFSNSLDRIGKERSGKVIHIITIMCFILFFVVSLRSDNTGIYPYQFVWQTN